MEEKKVLKTEPKLNLQLDENQKQFMKGFYEKDIHFLVSDHSSGKTALACYAAINYFRKFKKEKIWITRPILKNNLGILPSGISEKMSPYIYPIIQNLQKIQGKETTDKMLANGQIEIIPIDVAKGLSFSNSVVIVDEFMDCIWEDFRTIATRISTESKIIFCGSQEQIDKQIGSKSCIYKLLKGKEHENITWTELPPGKYRLQSMYDFIKFIES